MDARIVIDDKIPFVRGVFEPYAQVSYLPGAGIGPDDVRDADALIVRTRTACNEALLKGSRVRVVATATIGYDHFDTRWLESEGIAWYNAPGCNSGSVSHYVASVLAVLAQKHGIDLSSASLGIVGVGHVGKKVADVARAFGMEVLLNDPPRARNEGENGFVCLDELVRKSDIISLHVPLVREGEFPTYHLFDEKRIASVGKRGILINSSRGEVVDNMALKRALENGSLKGAVLDVWEGEPAIDASLASLLDVATPHIAGYSADGKAAGTEMAVHAVAESLGLPLAGWKVEDVPGPSVAAEFGIDARGKTVGQVLSEAVLHTYDVRSDSGALLSAVSSFEHLRGCYGVRREPAAFRICLSGGPDGCPDRLRDLGFSAELV